MMQVLQRELDRTRRPWRCATVRAADLSSFDGALVTDSHGMARVAQIDDRSMPTDALLMHVVRELLTAAPNDPI